MTSPVLEWDPTDLDSVRNACDQARRGFAAIRSEIGRIIVGQQRVVDETLVAIFAGGHVLLEGVPGLGKTLLVKTIAETLDLEFARIQFTPDVMPADVTGTTIVVENPATSSRDIVFRPDAGTNGHHRWTDQIASGTVLRAGHAESGGAGGHVSPS